MSFTVILSGSILVLLTQVQLADPVPPVTEQEALAPAAAAGLAARGIRTAASAPAVRSPALRVRICLSQLS
ncbi:hypothetical protein B1R27_24775 [Streptomyces sp. GKU 895]|nr:hypothetical protein B1R27_24775 [Streptomyces sp. GKU 895]